MNTFIQLWMLAWKKLSRPKQIKKAFLPTALLSIHFWGGPLKAVSFNASSGWLNLIRKSYRIFKTHRANVILNKIPWLRFRPDETFYVCTLLVPCLYRQQGWDELRRWERSEVTSGPGAAHNTPVTEAHTIHVATTHSGGQEVIRWGILYNNTEQPTTNHIMFQYLFWMVKG